MAQQEELVIVIKTETVNLVKGLATAKNGLADFGKDGKFNIDGLTKSMTELRRAAGKSFDQAEIRKYGDAIRDVQAQQQRLNSVLNNTTESTRRARIAIFGLNQVVRDLPFGFIAISNNLPVLFDQFQQLVREEKSVKNAFKSFASGILGVGGISIAISTVISLITAAVQKYGSLSEAVKGITRSQYAWADSIDAANESYNKFIQTQRESVDISGQSAASTEGEIALVQSLVKVIKDENATNEQRLGAKRKLSEIDKEIFGNLIKEKGAIVDLDIATQKYIRTIIGKAIVKAFSDDIAKLNVELFKQNQTFKELEKNARGSIAQYQELQKQNRQLSQIPGVAPGGLGGLQRNITPLSATLENAKREINEVTDAFFEQGTKVQGLARDLITLKQGLDNAVEGYADVLAGQKQTTEGVKSETKARRNATEALNKASQDRIALLRTELEAQKAYVETLKINDKDYLNAVIEIAALEAEIRAQGLRNQIKDKTVLYQALRNLDRAYEREIITITRNIAKEQSEAFRNIVNLDKVFGQVKLPESFKTATGQLKTLIDESNLKTQQGVDNWNNYLASIQGIANVYNQTLGPAIDSVFNAIENGQNIFDALGNALKRLIIDLIKTVAQAAILAAIINAISGGGAAGFSFLFKSLLGAGGGIGSRTGGLDQLLFGRNNGVAAPNINGPGGFALAGQVVFVQRGTDLVGVLDRSNARIGRVG
jgi:hypothetical protein